MAKNSPSDELVLEQAERRAALTGYLVNNAGEHQVADIAKALGLRANVAGKVLKDMADNGLVPQPRRDGGYNYYHAGEDVSPVKRTYTKRAKTAPSSASSAKDVELVVGGTLIIVGRNAETGRIRITLEDLA